MQNINFYKHFYKLSILAFCCMIGGQVFGQGADSIQFKLQLINDTTGTYGVYIRPTTGTNPTTNTLIASGQVTIVVPTGFTYDGITSVNASWVENARVDSPPENPDWDYLSIGFDGDSGTQIEEGGETLLFTFNRTVPCPDSILHLIENDTDPFNDLPNSAGNNPGNEITIIDFGTGETYEYHSNYNPKAADCNDCDGDGLTNAEEDTNGNGEYDPGIDASDLCDICDPFHPETAFLSVEGIADGIICGGDIVDTAYIFVAIEGGWPPYTVEYTDGTNNFTVNNYNSGDTIKVTPSSSVTYSLVSIVDDEGCVGDFAGLGGTAEITVEGPISVDVDPVSVSECSDNGSGFSATASNAGDGEISYLWQVNDGGGWIDLENGTPYSTVNTNSMSISDVAGLHNYQYRVKIWTATCDTVFSAPATLSVEGPLTFSAHPQDVIECGTNGTSFSATPVNNGVGTMNSLWQISTNGGGTFTDLADAGVYSGTAGNTLTISNTTGLNTYQYRMKIFSTECDTVFSDPALLTVEGPFSISTQPQDAATCGGEAVVFTVVVDNPAAGTILYQWQENDGSGWTDLVNNDNYNGVQSDSLSISDIIGLDGYQYQVIISSNTCSEFNSAAATITEEGLVQFTDNPDDFTTCDGSSASFTATLNTGGLNTPDLTWQVSDDDGVTFTDLSDAGVFSGTTTTTLSISDVAGLYDHRFRIKGYSGLCDTTFSADAILTVEGPISVTTHPVDATECSGDNAVFSAVILNSGSGEVTYRWQVSVNDGGLWTNLSNNGIYNGAGSPTLSISNTAGLDGAWYQLTAQTGTCSEIITNHAVLTVEGPVSYTTDPVDVQICDDGTAVSFSAAPVNANAGTMTYQWEVSTDDINFAPLAEAAPYSGTTTTTLTINPTTGLNGRYYRLATSTGVCTPFYSESALLTVEGPINIETDGDPDDLVLCSGDPAVFIIDANSNSLGTLLYQWQMDDGSGFVNLTNNEVFNGVQSDTLSIVDIEGMDGYEFQVLLTTAECTDAVTSGIATLTVEGPISFSAEPEDVQICDDGTSVSFSATPVNANSGTMSYQWEVSTDGGNTFAPLAFGAPYTGTSTTTLNISDVTGLNGNYYRLAVTTGQCAAFNTAPALLTVEGPIAVNTGGNPDDVTTCSGEPVIFIIDANANGLGDLIFQWEEFDGTTWSPLSNDGNYNGVQSDTLSIGDVAGLDGYRYRVQITTEQCTASVTSLAADLEVEGPLYFTAHPEDYTNCDGLTAFFEVDVINETDNGAINYQWEEYNGTTWTTLSNGGIYSGVTADRLDLNDVTGLYDNLYRVIISTPFCATDTSETAQLFVEGPLSITQQPIAVTECSGNSTTFEVQIANPGANAGEEIYNWEISTNGTDFFPLPNNDIYNGITTNILSISDVAGLGDRYYRVVVNTATCAQIISNAVQLTVEGPIEFSDHPDNSVFCSDGNSTTFSATAVNLGAGTMTYRWEVSTDNLNFAPVPDNAIYDDVTTTTLVINDPTGLTGRHYRLCARTTECNWVCSDAAELVVEGPIDITLQPQDITNCSDLGVIFNVGATNGESGILFYQWEISESGTGDWENLPNQGVYNGVRTDTLSIDFTAGLGGNFYRVKVWTPTCDTLFSDAAELSVEGPLSFTDEPDDVTICSGSGTSFQVSIDNPGDGVVSYQWEISTNGGQTFSDITNGGVYSGATTDQLDISDVAGLNGFKYRATIFSGSCAVTESYAANLLVEGPITITQQPVDASICSNVGHLFDTEVNNPGVGAMTFQWQLSTNSGGTWTDLSEDAIYSGTTTRDLRIDVTDGLDQYMYRMVIASAVCPDTTDEVTLTVRDACLDGTCDLDLDGLDNDTDPDDDNDQLSDYYEEWMTTQNVVDGWNYTDDTGGLLNYDRCNPDSDGDGIIDSLEDPDMDEINNGEETDGDGTLDGNPLDPCDPVLSAACIGISLDLKVMLTGPLIGSPDGLMRDDLRQLGLIPLTEPYTDISTFQHVGEGGGETINSTVLDVTGNDAIVDWVFVELRDADEVENVIATRSALLQRDGDIVDLDGSSYLTFQIATAGNYYVSVRHRNHLGVMSNFAFGLSPITQTFDFKAITTDVFGENPQKDLTAQWGFFAMWPGDINADGKVIYQGPANDIVNMLITVLSDPGNTENLANYITDGYFGSDIDMDGTTIYQGPGNDRNYVLFQTVLLHPDNSDNFANFIVFEQIPE